MTSAKRVRVQHWAGVACRKCKRELTQVGGLTQGQIEELRRDHRGEFGCDGKLVEIKGTTRF